MACLRAEISGSAHEVAGLVSGGQDRVAFCRERNCIAARPLRFQLESPWLSAPVLCMLLTGFMDMQAGRHAVARRSAADVAAQEAVDDMLAEQGGKSIADKGPDDSAEDAEEEEEEADEDIDDAGAECS